MEDTSCVFREGDGQINVRREDEKLLNEKSSSLNLFPSCNGIRSCVRKGFAKVWKDSQGSTLRATITRPVDQRYNHR